MDIYEVFENEMFDELVLCDFDTVNKYYMLAGYYVSAVELDDFTKEYNDYLDKFNNEKNRILSLDLSENRFELSKDCFKGKLLAETRDFMVSMMKKYFDKDTFESHKKAMFENKNIGHGITEAPFELELTLLIDKKYMNLFLSTIGYWNRKKGYFVSQEDWYEINKKYTTEINYINVDTGFKDVFSSWGRAKHDQIDMDDISKYDLIKSYLKTNTAQLKKMFTMIVEGLRFHVGKLSDIQEDINEYIQECEEKGLMIKVGKPYDKK